LSQQKYIVIVFSKLNGETKFAFLSIIKCLGSDDDYWLLNQKSCYIIKKDRERERESVRYRRERESECVCESERLIKKDKVWESVCVRECVCVREREWEREQTTLSK